MFHVGALNPVLVCVYSGGAVVVLKAFDPTLSWELIRDERITSTLMVPVMLQYMLAVRDPAIHDADVAALDHERCGAGRQTLIEQYAALDIEIHQVYGLTETCGPGCLISSEEAITRAGSTGRAFYYTEVRVVARTASDCDPDESGEVLLKGPHIMVGYWNQPKATEDAIVDGWLHTGDVATIDDEGFVTSSTVSRTC